MLEPLGQDIWVADGPNVDFYSFAYSTRMVVIRLASGGLWVWSPIALDDGLREELAAIGPVAHLVSPNKIHHLSLGAWHEAFPEALLWGPQSTIDKRADLPFAGALCDEAPAAWRGEIDQFHFDNSSFLDEVAFFHLPSRTAIFADLSENFSAAFIAREWSWWQRPIARLWKIVEPYGFAPLELRLSFGRRDAARAKLRRLLALKPQAVVIAHGEFARSGGGAYIRRAFAWLGLENG